MTTALNNPAVSGECSKEFNIFYAALVPSKNTHLVVHPYRIGKRSRMRRRSGPGLGIGKDSANDVGADDGDGSRRCQHKQCVLRGRAAERTEHSFSRLRKWEKNASGEPTWFPSQQSFRQGYSIRFCLLQDCFLLMCCAKNRS